jgi:hypothetical protein
LYSKCFIMEQAYNPNQAVFTQDVDTIGRRRIGFYFKPAPVGGVETVVKCLRSWEVPGGDGENPQIAETYDGLRGAVVVMAIDRTLENPPLTDVMEACSARLQSYECTPADVESTRELFVKWLDAEIARGGTL